jgi:predicted molibdopterin-dependent oxidoreductase YjgC
MVEAVKLTTVELTINGKSIAVTAGSTIAAAMAAADQPCRKSERGQWRSALCGMGICFECRAIVNGNPHTRTCQILCEPGMDVRTNG